MYKFTSKIFFAGFFLVLFFLGCKTTPPYYDSNVGYEFDENDKDFIEITGDFHKLEYVSGHPIMITCWYHHNAYRDYQKFLEAAVRIPNKTIPEIGVSPISVTSANFGPLDIENYKANDSYVIYRFSKNVDSLNRKAISNLVFQDSVLFNIGGKHYLFLSKMK